MSSGVVLASLVIVALGAADRHLRSGLRTPLQLAAFVSILLAAHLALASAFGRVDIVRGIGSIGMLMLMIVAGHLLSSQLMRASARELRRASSYCLGVLAAISLLGLLGILQPPFGWEKSAFPFTEPSHLALAAAPFLVATSAFSRPLKRAVWLLTFVVIGVIFQNLTMIVACALAGLITLRPKHILVLLLLFVPAALLGDVSYYVTRLDFSDNNQNLSSLVFLQGWQLMHESLAVTHYIGRGFQQLGQAETDAPATQLIYALIRDSLNLFDGGFNLSKVVSELGAIGIALALVFGRIVWSAIATLRAALISPRKAAEIPAARRFAAAIIVGYLIEMLVRGVGYFSPSGLLLVASLWIWYRTRVIAKAVACTSPPVVTQPFFAPIATR